MLFNERKIEYVYTAEFIEDLICKLETAPRMGADRDRPEGVRYIQLSDTLTRQIINVLKNYRREVNYGQIDNIR